MSKKALITGITGMVGSHLLDLLLKKQIGKIYGVAGGEVHWKMFLTI